MAGRTNHHQYRGPTGIGLFFYKQLSPKLITVLELSHRRYKKIYLGKNVFQNIAIGEESLLSRSPSTFLRCYLGYQYL